jgi:endonuclease-3
MRRTTVRLYKDYFPFSFFLFPSPVTRHASLVTQNSYPQLNKSGRKCVLLYIMTIKERYEKFIAYFAEFQPDAVTELDYIDPYQLVVATILSAQCTDKRVNIITPPFFKAYPDPWQLANAAVEDIFELIKTCSYPNNKAKNLLGMAQMLTTVFKGVVPEDVDELQKLPGVGRKTANVVASVVFNKPAMAVDTHVFRVAARIGLTVKAKNPLQAEIQLVKHIPEDKIPLAHHWLILHGRYICQARTPKCGECPITGICSYFVKEKGKREKEKV